MSSPFFSCSMAGSIAALQQLAQASSKGNWPDPPNAAPGHTCLPCLPACLQAATLPSQHDMEGFVPLPSLGGEAERPSVVCEAARVGMPALGPMFEGADHSTYVPHKANPKEM